MVTSITPILALSQKIRISFYGYIRILKKKGNNLRTLWPGFRKCHAHLYIIGIICSKFHQDGLKTVGGVGDPTYQPTYSSHSSNLP